MFSLHKDTIIYIFCPAGGITGGPEAMHQLCDAINLEGGNAHMVYIDYSSEEIIKYSKPLPYKIYCASGVTTIEDDKKNIVIVPEIWTHLLNPYSKVQKAVWWLSVNYLRTDDIFGQKEVLHLYQSVYAKMFLLAKGVEMPFPLFDYLNIPLSKWVIKKKRQVCYNPKRNLEATLQIIGKLNNRDIQFIELRGLSKIEMARVLEESKVYIDFGEHPGKDRIPREAALAGNIVITSKSGSANYFEDVPILNKYKFREDEIKEACQAVEDALSDYESVAHDFDYFRRVIVHQRKEFINQVAVLFVGMNHSVVLKFSRKLVYKAIPIRNLTNTTELLVNRLRNKLSPSSKHIIRKLFFTKH